MQSTNMEINTINKAVDHIKWRFEKFNGKQLNVSNNDIKAFNIIADFVEEKHNNQLNDYQLFAKLYITFYGELLRFYNAKVFDKEPQKALHKILDTDLEVLIKKFIDKATDIEQSLEYSEEDRLRHPHYKMKINGEIIEPYDKSKKGLVKILEPVMTYEEAEQNLTSMINLAINKFR